MQAGAALKQGGAPVASCPVGVYSGQARADSGLGTPAAPGTQDLPPFLASKSIHTSRDCLGAQRPSYERPV